MQRNRFRVLTYNVHSCVGTDRKLDPARIAEVIASCQPDIVGLQELDVGRQRTGAVDQADTIASILKMKALFHPAVHKAEEKYGDAILTSLPMRTRKTEALPSIGEPRGAIWAEILVGDTTIHVFNTHLGLRRRERLRQVGALLGSGWLGHPECRNGNRILMGDFNAVPASRGYQQLARAMSDVWKQAGKRPQATFPSRYPMLRLDHVFLAGDVIATNAHVGSTPLSRIASDHLPLFSDLDLTAG
ncbi:endonuclease/exonuclease/phosphatase family protein [Hoeflea sp. YIM 152468]|uniref:endonuclease/exonuclease/phosphatase family protein n=1 Tax=Hoeflea sp. YIM 152468 TaxID=3031759 RepID=UPI0023DA1443|nr:endonuclease/exonuclease/phosphatase family protein [Hoeflea sp. YIM 152468]MDF1609381.1 endonuclease/exonuclease/phosphatase family protein [Hoeflea sp. YIM 152468]